MIENNYEIIVSVIMPTYNHEKYVKQAIESALNQQTDFKYEILIGDDASTDGTQSILKKYSGIDNIRIFMRKNLGKEKHICNATKNICILLKKAVGKYIIFLEGDDFWENENFLQKYVDFLEEHPECAGVSGRRIVLSERTGKKFINIKEKNCNKYFELVDLLEGRSFDFCATLYRNIYHDGKYDYRVYLYSPLIGDLVHAVFILLHGDIYITDEIIGVYRSDRIKGASSYNAIKNKKEIYDEHLHLIKELERRISVKLDYSLKKIKYTNDYLNSIPNLSLEKFKAVLYVIRRLGIKDFVLNIHKLMLWKR